MLTRRCASAWPPGWRRPRSGGESRSSLAGLAARCVSFYRFSIYLSIYCSVSWVNVQAATATRVATQPRRCTTHDAEDSFSALFSKFGPTYRLQRAWRDDSAAPLGTAAASVPAGRMAPVGASTLHTVFTSECNNVQFDWFATGVFESFRASGESRPLAATPPVSARPCRPCRPARPSRPARRPHQRHQRPCPRRALPVRPCGSRSCYPQHGPGPPPGPSARAPPG